jgi:hypothetical protein
MRKGWNCNKSIVISILTILAFTVTNCAPVQMKNVVVQKSEHYKFTSHRDGLKISVDPYTEEIRLKDYFGCDLLSRGILPVLIVFENQSSEDGYVIITDKANLVTPDLINSGVKSDEGQKTDEVEGAGKGLQSANTVLAISPLFGVIGLAFALPLAFAASQHYENENAIKRNLEQKQMTPKTIYRGSSHSGFLYFKFGKTEDLKKVQGICLSIRNIRTEELLSFTIKTGRY